ncbi:MAG: site-specific integrase [Bacilli bacterium]|nr:site-specific integrase [Bacilli bacterium]
MARLTKEDISRFSISLEEANKLRIKPEDIKGINEIIPDKKYRIMISNGFKPDGTRNRISETYTGSLIGAIVRKKQLFEDIENKVITIESKSKFSEFSKLYLNYLEEKVRNNQLSATTYQNYYYILDKRILPYFQKMTLLDINERDIEHWIAVLRKTKTNNPNREFLHPTTIAHAYKTLYNMFNFAKLERILRENPCDFVHKKPTEAPDEKDYFTLEEMDYIKELLTTANIRLKTAIYLTMDTGCRREEICGLKWKDVDFENNTIDINKAVVSSNVKTNLDIPRVREKDVKTKNSKRKIGVPKITMDILKQYKTFKGDMGLKVKENDYIFTNWTSNKVLDPNRLTSDWANFRKEHGINKKVPIHGLRHSNATFLLSTGIPDKDVAKRLGHTTEVLARTYTHSNQEDDKKLVDVIEKSFYGDTNKFSLESICCLISGNLNNNYENECFKLMDFLTRERVMKDDVDKYLEPCKNYLLSKFPILEIFTYNNVYDDPSIFIEKIQNFKNFIGEKPVVDPPEDNILTKKIDI